LHSGEIAFRRGLEVGSGVVLFRTTPDCPEEASSIVLAVIAAQPELCGSFCVVTRDKIRVRPLRSQ